MLPAASCRPLRFCCALQPPLACDFQVGCGADELIDLLMRCVLDEGDKIVDCPPTFTMWVYAAQQARHARQAFTAAAVALRDAAGTRHPSNLPFPPATPPTLLDLTIVLRLIRASSSSSFCRPQVCVRCCCEQCWRGDGAPPGWLQD